MAKKTNNTNVSVTVKTNKLSEIIKLVVKDAGYVFRFIGKEAYLLTIKAPMEAFKYVRENSIVTDEDGNVVRENFWGRLKLWFQGYWLALKAGTIENWEEMKDSFKTNKENYNEALATRDNTTDSKKKAKKRG